MNGGRGGVKLGGSAEFKQTVGRGANRVSQRLGGGAFQNLLDPKPAGSKRTVGGEKPNSAGAPNASTRCGSGRDLL